MKDLHDFIERLTEIEDRDDFIATLIEIEDEPSSIINTVLKVHTIIQFINGKLHPKRPVSITMIESLYDFLVTHHFDTIVDMYNHSSNFSEEEFYQLYKECAGDSSFEQDLINAMIVYDVHLLDIKTYIEYVMAPRTFGKKKKRKTCNKRNRSTRKRVTSTKQ